MFESGDASGAADVFASDYADHQGLGGEPLRGPDGFARVVAAARNPDRSASLEITLEDVVADDEGVAARLRWRELRHDGIEVRRETIELLRVRDGKFVEHWGAEAWRRESTLPTRE